MPEITTATEPGIEAGKDEKSAAAFSPIETQEQFDKAIKARINRERDKFADYEELKEKAARLDEIEAANKSEIEKATERAEKAETKLRELEAQAERNAWVSEVAKETGLDASLVSDLSADSKDELLEKAKRHADALHVSAVPYVGSDTKPQSSPNVTNADIFGEFAANLFR